MVVSARLRLLARAEVVPPPRCNGRVGGSVLLEQLPFSRPHPQPISVSMLLVQGGKQPQKLVALGQPKELHSRIGTPPEPPRRQPLEPLGKNAPQQPSTDVTLDPVALQAAPLKPVAAPAEAEGDAWFLHNECGGSGGGQPFVLRSSSETVWVGRWRERVGLWLDDGGRPSKASRLHARFDRLSTTTPCSWRLVDNDSANGTYVNGVRIPQDGVELRDGDCIGFGSVPPPPASESSAASDGGVVSTKVHASDVARAAAATSDATPRFHYVIRFGDGPSHSVVTTVATAATTKGDVKPAAPNPAHAASNPAVRPPPTYEQRPSARRPHSAKPSAAASSVVHPVTSIANAPAAAAALDSANHPAAAAALDSAEPVSYTHLTLPTKA